jgi:phosphonatase-like hydrolase
MHKVKMVVFDMAGTVVDEQNIVYKTVFQALADAGYNLTLEDVLRDGAGKEKLKAIQDLMTQIDGQLDEPKSKAIHQKFKSQLDINYATMPIKEQPNASQLFAWLKENNIKVGLNTGYSKEIATLLLEKLNWQVGKDIDALVTADDAQNHRPAPDMILKACELLNIAPTATAKVGDSAIDIYEGKNAHCALNIGITTGAQTRPQLQSAKPDFVIDDLLELKGIILQ